MTGMPHQCSFPAPAKVWYLHDNGLWRSRDWLPGEKAAYERDVLNR